MKTQEAILIRIALLEARNRENGRIVRKLKRKLRALQTSI